MKIGSRGSGSKRARKHCPYCGSKKYRVDITNSKIVMTLGKRYVRQYVCSSCGKRFAGYVSSSSG